MTRRPKPWTWLRRSSGRMTRGTCRRAGIQRQCGVAEHFLPHCCRSPSMKSTTRSTSCRTGVRPSRPRGDHRVLAQRDGRSGPTRMCSATAHRLAGYWSGGTTPNGRWSGPCRDASSIPTKPVLSSRAATCMSSCLRPRDGHRVRQVGADRELLVPDAQQRAVLWTPRAAGCRQPGRWGRAGGAETSVGYSGYHIASSTEATTRSSRMPRPTPQSRAWQTTRTAMARVTSRSMETGG